MAGEVLAEPCVAFLKALARDAGALALASKRAFDNDIHYGAPGPGGPPGYDSADWQKTTMRRADYYKIVVDGEIAGGIIVFRTKVRQYELGRIYLAPEHQNKGIGTRAMDFLWETYPLAKRWTLGTPEWNRRTRHFYKKVGFVEIGRDRHGGILFERVIAARSPALPTGLS
jgi:RimJ/RimL family protein N-acetyltransferase